MAPHCIPDTSLLSRTLSQTHVRPQQLNGGAMVLQVGTVSVQCLFLVDLILISKLFLLLR